MHHAQTGMRRIDNGWIISSTSPLSGLDKAKSFTTAEIILDAGPLLSSVYLS